MHDFIKLFLEELESEHPATNGNGGSASTANAVLNNNSEKEALGNVQRISTRVWAADNAYDPELLFTKVILFYF